MKVPTHQLPPLRYVKMYQPLGAVVDYGLYNLVRTSSTDSAFNPDCVPLLLNTVLRVVDGRYQIGNGAIVRDSGGHRELHKSHASDPLKGQVKWPGQPSTNEARTEFELTLAERNLSAGWVFVVKESRTSPSSSFSLWSIATSTYERVSHASTSRSRSAEQVSKNRTAVSLNTNGGRTPRTSKTLRVRRLGKYLAMVVRYDPAFSEALKKLYRQLGSQNRPELLANSPIEGYGTTAFSQLMTTGGNANNRKVYLSWLAGLKNLREVDEMVGVYHPEIADTHTENETRWGG
ncbi:hypothetical protein BG015_004969 [Linnemannia schmuckeri]|uniref:Uncharacterized protein n=1 Tax=Linnemannia schmuckeri TaxID=64567 RepID=A0A9P5S3X8_9FUNG|nr:hypothetical protein BG015_004969 [Linnemannia schmuckeri]